MKRFSREWWGNHFRYQRWKYGALVLWAVLGVSFVFQSTAYTVPAERKVHVYLVGSYADPDAVDELAKRINEELPHIEEVRCIPIILSGNSYLDLAGHSQLIAALGGGEADILVFPRQYFIDYVKDGVFVPLDGYAEDGSLRLNEDMEFVRMRFEWEGETAMRDMGVPLYTQFGLYTNEGFDNSNSVMGLTKFSRNREQSVEVMQWIIDNRTEPMPKIRR